MLSPQVARALWQLYAGAQHIGAKGQPKKGTSDAAVLAHAKKRKQTVVTNNHDMIVLAAEQGASVIWLHGRRRELPKAEMVIVCFRSVEEWKRLLDEATEPICLRAYKTKTVVMPMDKAASWRRTGCGSPSRPRPASHRASRRVNRSSRTPATTSE